MGAIDGATVPGAPAASSERFGVNKDPRPDRGCHITAARRRAAWPPPARADAPAAPPSPPFWRITGAAGAGQGSACSRQAVARRSTAPVAHHLAQAQLWAARSPNTRRGRQRGATGPDHPQTPGRVAKGWAPCRRSPSSWPSTIEAHRSAPGPGVRAPQAVCSCLADFAATLAPQLQPAAGGAGVEGLPGGPQAA